MGRLRSRREVLGAFAAGAAGLAVGGLTACSDEGDEGGSSNGSGSRVGTRSVEPLEAPALAGVTAAPFVLGVGSGDPEDTSVVLWTRLVVDPAAVGGGLPAGDHELVWEVATEQNFDDLVATGTATVVADHDHTVHVVADDLDADSRYWYRFRVGDHTSPAGRTRTAPAPDATVSSMVVATGSCQNWQAGHYAAHRAMAEEEDLDLILWLGDYIYEGGVDPNAVRPHNSPEVVTLADYRARYSLYKTDEHLRAAHAAAPWLVIWDDHEVENNYAGGNSEDSTQSSTFAARRAAAYQAWWEYTPTRLDAPVDGVLRTYRDLRWGDLVHLLALDTRQDRADQVCAIFPGVDAGPNCPDLDQPEQTIMSDEQEQWLTDGLVAEGSRWNLVANQVVLSPVPVIGEDLPEQALNDAAKSFGIASLPPLDGLRGVLADQWDGYPQQRQRVVDAMAKATSPTVVLTGDIHTSVATTLHATATDKTSEPVGVELVGTSISSSNGDFSGLLDSIYQPNFEYYQSALRGYLRCEITPDEVTATYVVVDDALQAASPTHVDATMTVARDDRMLVRT